MISMQDVAALSPAERRELLARLTAAPTDGAERSAPASFAQERLWFLDRFRPGGAIYNLPMAMRIAAALDVPALERAIREVALRHETLRTTFPARDGRPVQRVAPEPEVHLPIVDLRDLPVEEREARAAQAAAEEGAAPFDLERGPLLRTRLLRLGQSEWALIVCMHHIIADGWSVAVFFREIQALYTAFAAGRRSPLLPPPIQYADYAARQRAELTGGALAGLLGWWREQLAGAPTLLDLPTDRPRPPVQSFRGGGVPCPVEPWTGEALRALAREEHATPFMVHLAAFALLLSRYTGQTDLLIGSPVAGRTRSELEGLIGFFVNTLVLRCELGEDPTFRGLVRRVRERTLGAFTHQDLPFEKLVEELQPERSPSHNPLFQVAFSYNNGPRAFDAGPSGGGGGLTHGTAKFDLMLFLSEQGQTVEGGFEYNADLFDPETVVRLAGHHRALLAGIAADPDRPLSRITLLSAESRARIGTWNDTAAPLPHAEGAARLIEAQARRTPDATAVMDDDGATTYAALDAAANRLARRLRGMGVGAGVCVGVSLERTAALVATVLAVFRAGGVYLPLDPGHPPDRTAHMLREAGAAVLVAGAAPPVTEGAAVLRLDTAAEEIAAEPAGTLEGGAGLGDPAYVIFTSGSTGRPKGTVVEHGSLLNLLDWYADVVPMGLESRSLLMIPIGFDAALKNLLGPLLRGGCAVLTRAPLSDAAALLRVVSSRGVTDINCTPTLFQPLVDLAAGDDFAPLASLRHVMLGGEAVRLPRLRAWLGHPGCACTLVNVYGPTDATDVCSSHVPTREEIATLEVAPIGRPVRNARLYVVDPHGNLQPPGFPGEICVAGACLARGYLARPELTAERFVPLPAAGEERVYRTGDRARWRDDGVLEYLGRLDDQVKVRGVRIEPGELEAALRAHPAVREAAVAVRAGGAGGERLVAYVVTEEPAPTPEELRDFLRRSTPEYMVPSAWAFLDALPLSPNGKVDRRALPEPGEARRTAYVAPSSALEEVIVRVWTDVLEVPRVGVQDNFFDLGGHSLLATQVVSRIRDVLDIEAPLHLLFTFPTVAGLAAALDAQGCAGGLERTAALTLSLDRMSDTEVEAMLRAGAPAGEAS
jgi:amino acid adenylation domain-containing protein